MPKPVLSHVDLRVRDRARAIVFYDAVLGALGHTKGEGEHWITYDPLPPDSTETSQQWFGFTVEANPTPGDTRVALAAESPNEVERVAAVARASGARNLEGPDYAYGPDYYAVFFEDPDGNRLEVCCVGPAARAMPAASTG